MAAAPAACPGPALRTEDLPFVAGKTNGGPRRSFLTLDENERHRIRQALDATGWAANGTRPASAILNRDPSTSFLPHEKIGLGSSARTA